MNDVIDQLHADCIEARDELRRTFAAARHRVARWEPAPAPARFAAPGFPALVERRVPAPVATGGGHHFLSIVPCVLSVLAPMVAGIYFGRFINP